MNLKEELVRHASVLQIIIDNDLKREVNVNVASCEVIRGRTAIEADKALQIAH
jgi:hypothetical protein